MPTERIDFEALPRLALIFCRGSYARFDVIFCRNIVSADHYLPTPAFPNFAVQRGIVNFGKTAAGLLAPIRVAGRGALKKESVTCN